jgi:hypothetical protein
MIFKASNGLSLCSLPASSLNMLPNLPSPIPMIYTSVLQTYETTWSPNWQHCVAIWTKVLLPCWPCPTIPLLLLLKQPFLAFENPSWMPQCSGKLFLANIGYLQCLPPLCCHCEKAVLSTKVYVAILITCIGCSSGFFFRILAKPLCPWKLPSMLCILSPPQS